MTPWVAWTPEQDARLLEMHRQGVGYEKIAAVLSTSQRTVTRKAVDGRLNRLRTEAVRLTGRDILHKSARRIDTEIPVTVDMSEWDGHDEPTGRHEKRDTDPAPPEEDELVTKLLESVKRKPLGLEALCDILDRSPSKVRELVELANSRGYRVEVDGDHVGRRPHNDAQPKRLDLEVMPSGERHTVAIVGDIHFGSKHHLGPQFKDYCRHAYERGARKFLHVGDLLDGVYRHSVWEQSARGYEEQVEVAIEELPRMDGATWYFIQGNHDETLGEANGLEVGRAIEQSFRAAGRKDLAYLGARAAYVRLVAPGEHRGVFVELWHPRDRSSAYAKSYRMQKRIEAYPPGGKPDILAAGHWHQSLYVPVRGVHAISSGCWQGGQSSFGKSLSGSPDIGSWIVDYAITAGGTVRNLQTEWIGYFETETVRDVSLG